MYESVDEIWEKIGRVKPRVTYGLVCASGLVTENSPSDSNTK